MTGLAGLTTDPPTGDIKKLSGGGGEYRLRIGHYRVTFQRVHSRRVVVVLRVVDRGRAYRD